MLPEARPEAFLLVTLSGRGLAQAAARAGRIAVGMDGFADRDTCDLAPLWQRLPLDANGDLAPLGLVDAAARLSPAERCLGLVYGSGFEAQPELLSRLACGRQLLGNPAEVLAESADPMRFASLARRLGLPFPEVQSAPPADPAGWLAKRAGGCGGIHVREAVGSAARPGVYFQRRVDGTPCSLLFLADGRDIRAIGFNRLLPAPPQAPGRWAYAGAVALDDAPGGVGPAVQAAARALTGALGLRGLNGIDFVVNDSDWSLLELNPRPTATLELWDAHPMPALFDLHVQSCLGRLPVTLPKPEASRAVAVAYAGATLRVPAGFPWPDWSADLPRMDTLLEPGDPVCTVHATAADAGAAERQALEFRQRILDRLSRHAQVEADRARLRSGRVSSTLSAITGTEAP